jgi:chromosome segregation ATPase
MDSEQYIDKKMRFVWDTLAEIAARQEKADARMARQEARMDRHEERMRKLDERFDRRIAAINKLILAGMRMITKDREDIRRLELQVKRTDERFDQWLRSRGGSNGHGGGEGRKRNGR